MATMGNPTQAAATPVNMINPAGGSEGSVNALAQMDMQERALNARGFGAAGGGFDPRQAQQQAAYQQRLMEMQKEMADEENRQIAALEMRRRKLQRFAERKKEARRVGDIESYEKLRDEARNLQKEKEVAERDLTALMAYETVIQTAHSDPQNAASVYQQLNQQLMQHNDARIRLAKEYNQTVARAMTTGVSEAILNLSDNGKSTSSHILQSLVESLGAQLMEDNPALGTQVVALLVGEDLMEPGSEEFLAEQRAALEATGVMEQLSGQDLRMITDAIRNQAAEMLRGQEVGYDEDGKPIQMHDRLRSALTSLSKINPETGLLSDLMLDTQGEDHDVTETFRKIADAAATHGLVTDLDDPDNPLAAYIRSIPDEDLQKDVRATLHRMGYELRKAYGSAYDGQLLEDVVARYDVDIEGPIDTQGELLELLDAVRLVQAEKKGKYQKSQDRMEKKARDSIRYQLAVDDQMMLEEEEAMAEDLGIDYIDMGLSLEDAMLLQDLEQDLPGLFDDTEPLAAEPGDGAEEEAEEGAAVEGEVAR